MKLITYLNTKQRRPGLLLALDSYIFFPDLLPTVIRTFQQQCSRDEIEKII